MGKLGLDTKGVCFLCLEKISSDDGDISVPGWLTGFCFRSISRFLKIDQQTEMLKKLYYYDKVINSSAYDFSVTLCETCYKISSKLTSIITELEKLQIMLDHQISTFHETLTKSQVKGSMTCSIVWGSEDVDVKMCKLFDGLAERQMEMVSSNLFESLRLETEDKCRLFIKNRSKNSPRVTLHRLDEQQVNKRKLAGLETHNEQISSISLEVKKSRIEVPAPGPVVDFQKNSGINSENKVVIKEEVFEDFEPQSTEPPPVCVPTTSETETMKLKDPTNIAEKLKNAINSNKKSIEERQQSLVHFDNAKNSIVGQVYQCPFCEVSFPFCNTIDFDVQLHQSNVHPDKLFSFKRIPQVSDGTFKEICLNLLLSEVKNTPRLNRHLLPTLYSCLYCKHVVEKAQAIKCHYIKCHYEILSGKLLKLQDQYLTNHQGSGIRYEKTSSSSLTLSIHSIPPSPPKGPVSLPMSSEVALTLPTSSMNQSAVSHYPKPSAPLPLLQQYRQIQATQDYSLIQTVQQTPALPPIQHLPAFNTIYNTGNRYNYNGNVGTGNHSNQKHYCYQNGDHDTGKNNEMMNYYYQNANTSSNQQLYSNYAQPQTYKSSVITETRTKMFHTQNSSTEIIPLSNNTNQRYTVNSFSYNANTTAKVPDSRSPNDLSDGLDPQSKTDGDSHVTCPYCKQMYSSNTIKLHIVEQHLDEDTFSESRLPGIDLDQFKVLRKLFVQREVDMCTKTIPEDSRKITITHCPYCTEKFLDKASLRVHLGYQHYYILREKFKKVQESHLGASMP